jgi:hypothetical protein
MTFKEYILNETNSLSNENQAILDKWKTQIKSIMKNKWFDKSVAIFQGDREYTLLFKFKDTKGAIRLSKKIQNLPDMTGSSGGARVSTIVKSAFGDNVDRVEIRMRRDFNKDVLDEIIKFTNATKINWN